MIPPRIKLLDHVLHVVAQGFELLLLFGAGRPDRLENKEIAGGECAFKTIVFFPANRGSQQLDNPAGKIAIVATTMPDVNGPPVRVG